MMTIHAKTIQAILFGAILAAASINAQSQQEDTCYITNIDFFMNQCPTLDAAIDEILSDFRITRDGVEVSQISCQEPISSLPIEAYTDELILLQALRIIYYMDKGMAGHLPWTNGTLYDWLKNQVGGFNFDSFASVNSCCGIWPDGTRYVTLITADEYNRNIDRTWPWLGFNIGLIMHEARHVDGFSHWSCCAVGPGACDLRYDEMNLSPYAIQYWLDRAWLEGTLYTGYGCLEDSRALQISALLRSSANNFTNRFCESPPPTLDNNISAPCLDCQPPSTIIALDDGPYVVDEGDALAGTYSILDNDIDYEGDPLTPILIDPPVHASFFEVRLDGTFDYTHDGSETTSDQFTYRASDGSNESEIATVFLEISPVNDAPEINLIGGSTISLFGGETFNDPGAIADDPEDGDISDNIIVGGETVDGNTEGTYVITYNVIDSEGLAATEVTRTVIVEINDPPVITLIGPATFVLQVGDTYEEQGATAHDPEDGDLTAQITVDNDVNISAPGSYTVTYTVEDSGGNQAKAQRTVIVEAARPRPPPPTSSGGGGGALSPFELLASTLMLLAIGGHHRMSASGR